MSSGEGTYGSLGASSRSRAGSYFARRRCCSSAGSAANDVVQHGGEALAISTDAKCHAERVEDVRLTGLIALAAVTLRREGNRILDRHDPLHLHGPALRRPHVSPRPGPDEADVESLVEGASNPLKSPGNETRRGRRLRSLQPPAASARSTALGSRRMTSR